MCFVCVKFNSSFLKRMFAIPITLFHVVFSICRRVLRERFHSSQTPRSFACLLFSFRYHVSNVEQEQRRRRRGGSGGGTKNTQRKRTHYYYIAPFNIGIFSSHWMYLCPNWFICSTSIFNSFMDVRAVEHTLIRLFASCLAHFCYHICEWQAHHS